MKDRAEVEPLTGEEIRAMREQAHMSQAVFAHYLNHFALCYEPIPVISSGESLSMSASGQGGAADAAG